jgi:hypothetical protein
MCESKKPIVILLINFLVDIEANANATSLILTTSEPVHFSKMFTEMR